MPYERNEIELPPSITIGRNRYFRRSEIRYLKATLIAKSMGAKPPAPIFVAPEDDEFVPVLTVAAELGISKRTLWRRIKESDDAIAAQKARKRRSA